MIYAARCECRPTLYQPPPPPPPPPPPEPPPPPPPEKPDEEELGAGIELVNELSAADTVEATELAKL